MSKESFSQGLKVERYLIFGFILAGVLLRLMPHPWNFTPLTALALFSGAYLRNRLGLLSLVLILFLSDLLLGFHRTMPFTWGTLLIVLWMGKSFRTDRFSPRILFGSLAGSMLFYVITNFGVFITESLYPRTFEGLLECYWMAVPFWRNAVLGDLVYTFTLFGSYHLLRERLLKPSCVLRTAGALGDESERF